MKIKAFLNKFIRHLPKAVSLPKVTDIGPLSDVSKLQYILRLTRHEFCVRDAFADVLVPTIHDNLYKIPFTNLRSVEYPQLDCARSFEGLCSDTLSEMEWLAEIRDGSMSIRSSGIDARVYGLGELLARRVRRRIIWEIHAQDIGYSKIEVIDRNGRLVSSRNISEARVDREILRLRSQRHRIIKSKGAPNTTRNSDDLVAEAIYIQ